MRLVQWEQHDDFVCDTSGVMGCGGTELYPSKVDAIKERNASVRFRDASAGWDDKLGTFETLRPEISKLWSACWKE